MQLGTVDGDELLEHLLREVVRGVEVDGPQLLQVAVLHPVLLKKKQREYNSIPYNHIQSLTTVNLQWPRV